MKKTILVSLLILIFSTVLFGCSLRYAVWQWQSVSISDVGTFRVPGDWIVTQSNNAVYITDKPIDEEGYKIYLIGKTQSNISLSEYLENINDIKFMETVNSTNYSNNASFSKSIYVINEIIEEKCVLTLHNSNKVIYLYAWDNLIDEDTMKKIAQSYDPY